MTTKPSQLIRRAFTLVEMLVVISIIAILASILLPAIAKAKTKAKIAYARTQMKQIEHAVATYKADYSRLPSSTNAANTGVPDFTFGTVATLVTPNILNGAMPPYEANNSELISILADMLQFANSTSTVNANHARNPRQIKYLNFKQSAGDTNNPTPEVGIDGIFRDPWSRPYFATLDLNYDEVCLDAVYRRMAVSQQALGNRTGFYGTYNADAMGPDNNFFGVRADVMIWSPGPDRNYNLSVKADTGVNKDNILSWYSP